MNRLFGGCSEYVYSILRVVVGVLFVCHGSQKLFGAFGGQSMIGDPLMLSAGVIEFGGGLLIALGLWAGYAAFITSGQMAVAYFMFHGNKSIWPIVNKGELAAVYCFVFFYIAFKGSGVLSLDALLSRRGRANEKGASYSTESPLTTPGIASYQES